MSGDSGCERSVSGGSSSSSSPYDGETGSLDMAASAARFASLVSTALTAAASRTTRWFESSRHLRMSCSQLKV